MKLKLMILPLVLNIIAFPAFSEDLRKSPYFIDGVHCEGLEDKDREEQFVNTYGDDALGKMGVKTMLQEQCEQIYSQFGIEKFNWVTPEDLEKLTLGLNHLGKFKTVNVRIEKSEIQNHVHLITKFEQFEPQTHYSLNFVSGFDKGGVTGDRLTTKTEGTVQFQKRGPKNRGAVELGFKALQSSAKSPLSSDELSLSDGPVVAKDAVILNENEKAAQLKPSWQYNEFFYGIPFTSPYAPYPVNFSYGLNASRLAKDEVWDSNFWAKISSRFKPNMFMSGDLEFTLLYSTYTATGAERIIKPSKDEPKKKSKLNQIVFAGISQDFDIRFIKMNLNFHRSLTTDLHYFGNYNLQIKLPELAGVKNSIGFSEDAVQGAILPEHRFGLPNRFEFRTFYLGERNFTAFGAESYASLKLGIASLDSSRGVESNSYFRSQRFAEVGLKTTVDQTDVGLSFIYGSQRLY